MSKTKAIFAGSTVLGIPLLIALRAATYKPSPPRADPVEDGVTRIGVIGYTMSGPTGKAHDLANLIAKKYPKKYDTYYYFDNFGWGSFSLQRFADVPFPDRLKGHSTSPFVWLEQSGGKTTPIGGSDDMSTWALETFSDDEEVVRAAKQPPPGLYFHVDNSRMTAHCTKYWGAFTKTTQ